MRRHDDPTRAEHLANILAGNANARMFGASVQRSHRFPIQSFIVIENLAKLANCSVAAMINEIIEVGIESLSTELTPEISQQIHMATQEQIDKVNSQVRQKIGKFEK